jgi:hypothetical protein
MDFFVLDFLALYLPHSLNFRDFVPKAAIACGMKNASTSFTVRGGL